MTLINPEALRAAHSRQHDCPDSAGRPSIFDPRRGHPCPVYNFLANNEQAIRQGEQMQAAVEAIHTDDTRYPGYCVECGDVFPCKTLEALRKFGSES